jgi:hypothetical protein
MVDETLILRKLSELDEYYNQKDQRIRKEKRSNEVWFSPDRSTQSISQPNQLNQRNELNQQKRSFPASEPFSFFQFNACNRYMASQYRSNTCSNYLGIAAN